MRRRLASLERFLFHPDVDLGIAIGRVEADMAEPTSDDVDVNSRFQEMHGGCVAEDVRRDGALIWLGRNMACMTPNQLVEAETSQRPTGAVQEYGAGRRSRSSQLEHFIQHPRGLRP
jgi:hypothetical protein